MYNNLRTLLEHRINPAWLLAPGLLGVMLVTALGGAWNYQNELKGSSSQVQSPKKIGITKPAEITHPTTPSAVVEKTDSNTPAPIKQVETTASKKTTYQNASSSAPANESSAQVQKVVEVSLSVNGVHQGYVAVLDADNQCMVLSKAWNAGVISTLDMRYNSQYKTHAVYVINGIGDTNTIWWTYTVNGRSPPYGCSGTTVRGGDLVNWQYVR